ncbi:MAG: hypothetical protein V2A74_09750 [bacterium]
MPEVSFTHGLALWLTCFLTLAIFSFLYRDNPIYKLAEHLYLGVAAGYYFVQAFRQTIYPNLFQHVATGMEAIHAGKDAWATQWRWGALVLGILVLMRLVPKYGWLSRWPMGLVVGALAGLNLVGYARANIVDQMHATYIPIAGYIPGTPGMKLPLFPHLSAISDPSVFNNLILIIGVVSVLTYFFFSEQQASQLRKIGQVGIGFVMVTFGATYGSIVLARVSLLIGRVQTLTDANQPGYGYPTYASAAIIIALLLVWRIWFFKPEEVAPAADEAKR